MRAHLDVEPETLEWDAFASALDAEPDPDVVEQSGVQPVGRLAVSRQRDGVQSAHPG